MNRVNVTIKYKQPGKRGYQFRHTSRGRTWVPAQSWLKNAWETVERDGGEVVAAIVTPAGPW